MNKKFSSLILAATMSILTLVSCDPSRQSSVSSPSDSQGSVSDNSASVALEGEELFGDVAFTGFGVPEALGSEWSVSTSDHRGRITKIRKISKPVSIIPYGPATGEDGVNLVPEAEKVHWDFIEGEKKNIIDPEGNRINELFDFRICVSNSIVENTADSLIFEQYNDYLHETYPQKYPVSDKKLVKRVQTDKHGKIKLYYNSYNDISNAAYNFSSQFADNTWPHFYLNQNFHTPVDLALYSDLDFRVTVRIDKAEAVNLWPLETSDRYDQPLPPEGAPKTTNAQLQSYFLMRDKNSSACWFAGICYWSSTGADQTEVFTNEQHGVPFYRIGIAQEQGEYFGMQGEQVVVGKDMTLTYSVYDMLRYILARKLTVGEKYVNGGLNPYYGKSIDDYYIADFHIGWENMGNWDCECTLSDITLKGKKK